MTTETARARFRLRSPLRDREGRIAFVIALCGVAVAGYLTYIHYAGIKPICASGSGGCETVQSSAYADLAGIPVAVLGLTAYLAILGSLFIAGEPGLLAGFGVATTGFLFSAYLTYRELFTIKAICQWCVGSAVLMTALAVVTTIRLLRAPDQPRAPDRPRAPAAGPLRTPPSRPRP